MTADRKNSSAPPAMSWTLVGGASPVGRAAGPMTTMFFASLFAGSACFMLLMASSQRGAQLLQLGAGLHALDGLSRDRPRRPAR